MRTAEPAINTPPPPEEQPRHSGHSRLQTVASSSRHSASCSHIRQHWSSKWKEVFVQLELWTAVAVSVFTWNTFRHFTHFEMLVFPLETTAMLSHRFIIRKKETSTDIQCTAYTYYLYYTVLYILYICTVHIVCIDTFYLCSLQLTLIIFRETETRGAGQTPG